MTCKIFQANHQLPIPAFGTTDPTIELSIVVANQRSDQTIGIVASMTKLSALVAGAASH